MSDPFSALKGKSKSQFEKLNQELTKLNNKSYGKDERYWTPTRDKSGNGYAEFRFLPPPANEELPYVTYWDHGFQGPGGWYIENSRTSLGKDEKDPVAEFNKVLWNSTTDAEAPARKQASAQKRRLHYVSNIYVVDDPANPQNNGKVFLFKYGKKIFDKLNEMMYPPIPKVEPVNPFDFWEGATFQLVIYTEGRFPNYDKSRFMRPEPLAEDDKLREIYGMLHPLAPILDPSNFKPYDELKTRLDRVLGLDASGKPTPANSRASVATEMATRAKAEDTSIPWDDETPAPTSRAKAAPAAEEDDLSFFDNMKKMGIE